MKKIDAGNSIAYRISNGTAAATSTSAMKTYNPNNYHYSSEPLFSTHKAFIVPKGSPLQVEQTIVGFRILYLTTTNRDLIVMYSRKNSDIQ